MDEEDAAPAAVWGAAGAAGVFRGAIYGLDVAAESTAIVLAVA
jgi:hypothetical protein